MGILPERRSVTNRMERVYNWRFGAHLCMGVQYMLLTFLRWLWSRLLCCEFECLALLRKFWYPLLPGVPPFESNFGAHFCVAVGRTCFRNSPLVRGFLCPLLLLG
jgi:hypothetical protein